MNRVLRVPLTGIAAAAWLACAASADASGVIVTLGPRFVVPDGAGVPNFPYFPDGHIATFPEGEQFQLYWAGSSSYRTLTDRATFLTLAPTTAVLGPGPAGAFDNNGAWLYSVFRVSGDQLIGFYHAEDTEWPDAPGEHFIAWKSAALATSSDNGVSWSKQGQLLVTGTVKPSSPTWGGNGDFSVVYDAANARWAMLYTDGSDGVAGIKLAISTDPAARPGTWFKWRDGAFTEPGLGGLGSRLPGLADYFGGNPSVHFNTHLGRWVMVWHSWALPPSPSSLWLSTSLDLIHWELPQVIAGPAPCLPPGPCEQLWYPTIIGDSDQVAGRDATLAYAYFPDRTNPVRQFVTQSIRLDACGPVDDPVCDDGDPCTVDTCSAGVCTNVVGPRTGCHGSSPLARSRLLLRDPSPERRALVWKSTSVGPATIADLGDPRTDTAYELCVHDATPGAAGLLLRATAPAGGVCAGGPCWKAVGGTPPRGYTYRDPDREPEGLAKVSLRLDAVTQPRIQIAGRGVNLSLRSPLTAAPPLRVQLHASNGQCWEATYSTLVRNEDDLVEAR